MRERYVPDAEAQALAVANAERRGAKSEDGYRLNFDHDRMRQAHSEVEDPFELEQLVDGQWVDPPAPHVLVGLLVGTALVVPTRERRSTGPPRPSASLNRKRHGRAAVCPRHGETRGGVCRKCVR